MTAAKARSTERTGRFVSANGIDIHITEFGSGEPLVLLHGGLMSHGPAWAGFPGAYVDHFATLGKHFRVIAHDTRSHGATAHNDGTISVALLADDVAALVAAMELDRPLVCGFSEGGLIATVLGIRHPNMARAIVNDAGYDVLNPQAPIFAMGRMMLGGSPEATEADPDATARFFDQDDDMRQLFDTMCRDFDDAQGDGYWREYLRLTFHRFTRSPGYTFDDLGAIAVPALVLVGDRDFFCSVEEGAVAYRALPNAEFAVAPDTGHVITPEKVQTTIDFLRRHTD